MRYFVAVSSDPSTGTSIVRDRRRSYPLLSDASPDFSQPERCLTAAGDLLKARKHLLEQAQVRIALGKRDPHLAHGDFNLGADLEQLEPNRIALRLGQLGPFKSPTTQGLHQDISER